MALFGKGRTKRLPIMLTEDEAEVITRAAELLGTTASGLLRDATLPKAVAMVSEVGSIADAAEALRTDIYNQRRFTLVMSGNKLVTSLMDLVNLVDQDLGDEYTVLANEMRRILNKANELTVKGLQK